MIEKFEYKQNEPNGLTIANKLNEIIIALNDIINELREFGIEIKTKK